MATFVTVEEAIELLSLGNNDILQRDRMKMLKFAKYVYEDMKLTVLKLPKREYFNINKRTNTIDLPCESTQLSSVNVEDRRTGIIYPVWRNERLHDDIVDVAASRDCSCEHKCGYKVCNTIKGYEATTETITDKMPNGDDVSFTCTNRKVIDGDWLVEQKQYPQRVYLSGVWTDTILYTENISMCKVEVDDNGCVCDTEANIDAICGTCSSTDNIPYGGNASMPPCEGVDTWKYYCNTKLDWFSIQGGQDALCHNPFNMIYNISELGNRLIFPSNFGFDRVLVRYYATQKTNEIKIPLIAIDAFILGLKWWNVRFDDKKQNLAQLYEQKYSLSKWGLFGELNKRRLAEYRMILTPPVYVPSFIENKYNGWQNY